MLSTKVDFIQGICSGDRGIMGEMYKEMLPAIGRLAASAGLGKETASDVFQDAVLIVFEKARQPDFQLSSTFSTFFYGICRNLIGNQLKKKSGREVSIPLDASFRYTNGEDLQHDMEEAERQRLFHRAFQQLGKDCQLLLQLSFEGHPPEEIMKQLGIASYDYFRRRKYLCKEKLMALAQKDPAFREWVRGELK